MKVAAFLASAMYAIALTTPRGRKWTIRQTWATVVVGVMMTLLFVWLEDRKSAERVRDYFIATGIPIIARSLILHDQDLDGAGL